MTVSSSDLYYDPYDIEIDLDPYPTYQRLRDEAPLYYNDRLDFWGLSRYADVEAALKDLQHLSSAKGDILEVVKADPVMPPGVFINEDPPLHTMHRALVSRMFTPRRMREVEEKVRAFCAACLDPLEDAEQFDFVRDLGAEMPMRAIGILVGIPDADLPRVRDKTQSNLRNEPGKPLSVNKDHYFNGNRYAEYVEWREKNPSDDLITELLAVEFEDLSGTVRRLTKDEIPPPPGVPGSHGDRCVRRQRGNHRHDGPRGSGGGRALRARSGQVRGDDGLRRHDRGRRGGHPGPGGRCGQPGRPKLSSGLLRLSTGRAVAGVAGRGRARPELRDARGRARWARGDASRRSQPADLRPTPERGWRPHGLPVPLGRVVARARA